MDFNSLISKKRYPIPTPNDIIDENGIVRFGTFDKEFPNISMLDVKKPSVLPDNLSKMRLTTWEAVEINLDECMVLAAVCEMNIMGTALTIFYDKSTGKVTYWSETLSKKDAVIAKNLLADSVTQGKGKANIVKFVNDFGNGKACVCGKGFNKKTNDKISFKCSLERVSKPSVVVIPFGENRPLYTQKDMFKANGYIEFNGKRYNTNENSAAVIDDHKGYYPYRSHYDWLSTMGTAVIDGKKQYFGFNLTENQSTNPTDYNENLIWFENELTNLTPVHFEHINGDKFNWTIKDEHGMVDIHFMMTDEFMMRIPAKIIDVDYHITFGTLEGYICKPDGTKIILDGMTGIGEDRTFIW